MGLLTLLLLGILKSSALQIEVYGDSLSVAFMAQTSLATPPSIEVIGKILSDLSMHKISGEEKFIAPYKRPENTWGSFLSEKLKHTTTTTYINRAHEGDRAIHVPGQIAAIPKTKSPSLAFIFIGHNDLCAAKTAAESLPKDFENQINESLKLWDDKHQNSKMYLIQVGDVPQVFEMLENVVWAKTDQFTFNCRHSWRRIFPFCSYLAKLQQEGKMKEVLNPLMKKFNLSLEKLAKKWNETGSSNHFTVLNSSNNIKYELEDFAVDCFHLSKRGQQRLADQLFKDL